MQLKTTPPKWTADWFPDEFKTRKYIFDTWRKVCLSYGFEEYLWPLVEDSAIWEAKSGEDVWWSELTKLTDKSGKISSLALRPEMTPTVTRMVSKVWKEVEKPVKWFSIANFYRNERPQKGRNREFWQLNCDIFGQNWAESDLEMLCLWLDLMLEFNPPKGSFTLKLNHRWLLNTFFENIWENIDKIALFRILDKYEKLKIQDFKNALLELWLTDKNIKNTINFLNAKNLWDLENSFEWLEKNEDYLYFKEIFKKLWELWYSEYIEFSGSLIRGFDYYDGIIFEMFDNNKENPRALFWGWRYNGLANIFWVKEDIPAVWMAPGDETMKIFLENWGVLEKLDKSIDLYYLPLFEEKLFLDIQKLAKKLRSEGKNVLVWLTTKKLQKAMKFCDKNNIKHIIIFWEEEREKEEYIVKNLESLEEENFRI